MMAGCQSTAVLLVNVIALGTAMHLRKSEHAALAQPGTGEACWQHGVCDSEVVLDKLSYKVYEAGNIGINQTNLMIAGGFNQSDILASQEAARISHFLRVADHARSLGAVGGNLSVDTGGYCCHHVPVNNPYWEEVEDYSKTHPGYIKCKYSDGCTRPITNGNRVGSLRRALFGSQTLFHYLGVQAILYGGSALGQYRCGDVIPWDVDCDFMISEGDAKKIHRHVFGDGMNYSDFRRGEESMDLGRFGAPGIRLVKKYACAPFEIVDTQHGFFCDVFTSKWGDAPAGGLYSPWWAGPADCKGMFPCDHDKCYKFATETIAPVQLCTMASEQYECAANMPQYLEDMYGPGFAHPDREGIPVQ